MDYHLVTIIFMVSAGIGGLIFGLQKDADQLPLGTLPSTTLLCEERCKEFKTFEAVMDDSAVFRQSISEYLQNSK
jgi:hypothetical protein